jgi:hypothetical protein
MRDVRRGHGLDELQPVQIVADTVEQALPAPSSVGARYTPFRVR